MPARVSSAHAISRLAAVCDHEELRSLGVGKRYSGAETDPAAGMWPDRVDTGVGRPASPIRAARRVNPALQMMPLSGGLFPYDGKAVPPTCHQRFKIRPSSRSPLGQQSVESQAKTLNWKSRHRPAPSEMMLQNFREPQTFGGGRGTLAEGLLQYSLFVPSTIHSQPVR